MRKWVILDPRLLLHGQTIIISENFNVFQNYVQEMIIIEEGIMEEIITLSQHYYMDCPLPLSPLKRQVDFIHFQKETVWSLVLSGVAKGQWMTLIDPKYIFCAVFCRFYWPYISLYLSYLKCCGSFIANYYKLLLHLLELLLCSRTHLSKVTLSNWKSLNPHIPMLQTWICIVGLSTCELRALAISALFKSSTIWYRSNRSCMMAYPEHLSVLHMWHNTR